jgi:hypothetical protein
VLGGCQSCAIQNNVFRHTSSLSGASFGALVLHTFPGGGSSGNYTGTDVSGNFIDCLGDYRRCGFGLLLGASSWYPSSSYGGNIHDNVVNGAKSGFTVDNFWTSIANNWVSHSGGTSGVVCNGVPTQMYLPRYNITPGTPQPARAGDMVPTAWYESVSVTNCLPS